MPEDLKLGTYRKTTGKICARKLPPGDFPGIAACQKTIASSQRSGQKKK
jgi:hypothetical protein